MISNINRSISINMWMDDVEESSYDNLRTLKNRRNNFWKNGGGWQHLGLDHPINKGIFRKGYKVPTPIQRKAIPAILEGKDVVAMSRTGSGKTAAFVVPLLQKLKKRDSTGTRALLLSPTRELALQTFKIVKELGRFTGLRCECLIGGDSIEGQFSVLHEHPDILIATPGRLLHIMIEMNLKLRTLNYLVFDEADRLFEMGFSDQLEEILRRVPDSRQTLLFSATLPKILVDFAKAGLFDPILIRLDLDSKLSDKLQLVFAACRQNEKLMALIYLCRILVQKQQKTIVFCATMKHVEYVQKVLSAADLDCTFLYSQLDPIARKENILRFREGHSFLLIVTDLAARGVDIPILDVAINYHFPSTPKLFIHRVGRVARAGKHGTSINLIAPDEIPYLIDLQLSLGKSLKFVHQIPSECVNVEDCLLVGRFPENFIQLEVEFLNSLNNSAEILELQKKSENAMKKYLRTRPQPSSESISRNKKEFRRVSIEAHPFFDNFYLNTVETGKATNSAKSFKITSDERDQLQIIRGISEWRPNSTIFELNKTGNHRQIMVMKLKRISHQKKIEKNRYSLLTTKIKGQDQNESNVEDDVRMQQKPIPELTVEDDNQAVKITRISAGFKSAPINSESVAKIINGFELNTSLTSKNEKKKSLNGMIREREKMNHYISYQPSDSRTETALAVEVNAFDTQARSCSLDICADDDKGLYLQMNKKKWDRKRKKFVMGENHVKKIRTEEGIWLPATYKSGRYDTWKKHQRIHHLHDDEQDVPCDQNAKQQRDNIPKRTGKGKVSFGNKLSGPKQNSGDLKKPEQILKQRQKKLRITTYQTHRRKENMKRKQFKNKYTGK